MPVLAAIRRHSRIKVTMQIAHAGRKASSRVPWEGGQLIPIDEGGWLPDAPSSVPQKEGEPAPRRLDRAGLARVRDAFVATARSAARIDGLGSMRRTVTYCTSSSRPSPTTDRVWRLARIGCAFPRGLRRRAGSVPGRPARGRAGLGHRLGRRWLGRPADDRLRSRVKRGVDWIVVSSGGVSPAQKIALGPGYQVPFAQAIKAPRASPRLPWA